MRARPAILLWTVLAALLLALAAGCSPKPTLVGTWKGESEQGPTTIEFGADGTFSQRSQAPVPGGQQIPIVAKGTFVAENDNRKLTVTVADIEIEGLPEALKPMAEPMINQLKAKPLIFDVEWIAADEIKVSLDGQPINLKREPAAG